MSGWAGAVRAARRDARKTPGRTALVLMLIALPVVIITAGDTLVRTHSISVRESLPQRIGTADALLRSDGGTDPVTQTPDLTSTSGGGGTNILSQAAALALLPPGSRTLPLAEGNGSVSYPDGVLDAQLKEIDLNDPLTHGLVALVRGRLTARPDEVLVTQRLVSRGFDIGDPLPVRGKAHFVVGVIDVSPSLYSKDVALAVGPPGAFGLPAATSWLAKVPGGVPWHEVRGLNTHGLYVLSRDAVENPPPSSQVVDNTNARQIKAFYALVAALALLQVVLLAAPAFAVGARRQRRVLALIAATGAAPKHVRRFVLAQGVVLGTTAGLGGALLGVGAGAALTPLLPDQGRFSGPLEISWRDVLLTGGVGALSAILAALVPALIAGRQDVLAGLTGRRGTTGRSLRSFSLGLLLVVLGIYGCVQASDPGSGQFTIVIAAIPTILGTALLAPAVLGLVSRRVSGLPFPVRFALRDAARSRGRTAAAAAAVTATVAGAIALGIGGASDAEHAQATYTPSGPRNAAIISVDGADSRQLTAIREAVARWLPDHPVADVDGIVLGGRMLQVSAGGQQGGLLTSYGSNLNAGALVGPGALDLLGLTPTVQQQATATLAAGGMVIPADDPSGTGPLTVTIQQQFNGPATATYTGRALRVPTRGGSAVTPAVLPPAVAARLGIRPQVVGLLVRGAVSKGVQDRLQEQLSGIGAGFVQVERGYDGSSKRTAILILAAAAGALMLGGTLSAALLALSDARPDFATLMSVGASPRIRRKVAAAYAGVIGLLGSVLGALAGLVPGIAISYPLTSGTHSGHGPSHYLAIPWLLVIGLTVGVPMVAAGGAALLTRSRLPLAARLEL
ncbi:MAG: transporter permease [Frankiales bacterium]|nr:transporter permease [Frankiales bacterium]